MLDFTAAHTGGEPGISYNSLIEHVSTANLTSGFLASYFMRRMLHSNAGIVSSADLLIFGANMTSPLVFL